MKKPVGKLISMALAAGAFFDQIPFYKRLRKGGLIANIESRSKYQPHQGTRECAKRREKCRKESRYVK